MKIALSLMLVLGFVDGGSSVNSGFGNERKPGPGGLAQTPPPTLDIFPFKETYLTTEGDPFFIALAVDCFPQESAEGVFALGEIKPRFVTLSDTYRSNRRALALVAVNPGPGDAGTYRFDVALKLCSGSLGDRRTLKVKVKKAR